MIKIEISAFQIHAKMKKPLQNLKGHEKGM